VCVLDLCGSGLGRVAEYGEHSIILLGSINRGKLLT
jgi:hypothetical protein